MGIVQKALPAAHKSLRAVLGGPLYQEKRLAGAEERWGRIAAHLGPADRSLLDLGCNAGMLSRRAAEAGLLVVGCDVAPKAIEVAQRRHKGVAGLGFMLFQVTPESIEKLPEVDVVLCLSVHHYWVRTYGEAAGWDMVRVLLQRTRRKLFFEPASRRAKYRPEKPDFVDFDRDSIARYNTEHLRAACGGPARIDCLGETAGLGKELFRMLFLVDKGEGARR